MTNRQEWRAAVQALADDGTAEQVEDLAARMYAQVAAPGSALGDCLDAPGGLGQVARFALIELGPASVEGLLATPDFSEPADRSWYLERLLEAELQVRARVRARLMAALDDPAWLPDPRDGPYMESYPPRRRVCDEAYVAMRALTHPEEDQVGFDVESEQFLHMPVQLKDEVIARAKSTHVWNLSLPEPNDD
jgi:hypothetical protein